jgi:beta-glucosidase
LNKGDKDYQPLFAYGYGLTYARAHAPLGRLDETPAPERCGPAVAAAAEDLVLFQQVVNPAYRLVIGSPPNWRLPIGDDLNAVVTTSDGHVKAETAQLNGQQDARRITFTDDGQFAVDALKMQDLAGWLKSDATLAFDIAVDQAAVGNVHVRVDCGHPCTGSIDVTAGLRALPLHTKTTLRLPLRCFADHGADMAAVDTPFGIDTDKPFAATLANIRWEVGAPKSEGVLACTPAKPRE